MADTKPTFGWLSDPALTQSAATPARPEAMTLLGAVALLRTPGPDGRYALADGELCLWPENALVTYWLIPDREYEFRWENSGWHVTGGGTGEEAGLRAQGCALVRAARPAGSIPLETGRAILDHRYRYLLRPSTGRGRPGWDAMQIEQY